MFRTSISCLIALTALFCSQQPLAYAGGKNAPFAKEAKKKSLKQNDIHKRKEEYKCHHHSSSSDSCTPCDKKLAKSITKLNKKVEHLEDNPVSGTFVVGSKCFPTINSVLDKLKGKAVDDVLIILESPTSGVKTYTELLVIDDIVSEPSQGKAMPQSEYPLQDFSELSLIESGLSLRGDPRYIAGMTYIDGAQLNYFNDMNVAGTGYVKKLGTPYSIVDLQRPAANQIRVVVTSVPPFDPENNTTSSPVLEQPDFVVEDVVPGDHLLIRNDTGIWNEVVVTSVAGNLLTYSGPDITALGVGSALVITPRVKITIDVPQPAGAAVHIACGMTIQGVWFQAGPLSGDAVNVFNGGIVKFGQCLFDSTAPTGGGSLVVGFQSQAGSEVSGIRMHNTAVCGSASFAGLFVIDGGRIDDGDWCVFDAKGSNVNVVDGITSAQFNSLNSVGSHTANLNVTQGANVNVVDLLGSYNYLGAVASVGISRGSHLSLALDNLQIDNSGTPTPKSKVGMALSRGSNFNMDGAALYNSKVTGCSQGFQLQGGSEVDLQNAAALKIDNCSTGIFEKGASRFIIQSDIAYPSTTTPHIVEVDSRYSAVNSTTSTPTVPATPAGILTWTISGPIDSTIENQLLASGAITMTLDPTTTLNGVKVYVGKHYKIYSNSANAHTLSLGGGAAFIGAGAGTLATFSAVAGSGLEFTVLSPTTVLIHTLTNVTVS